ncbi:MAG TPA: hypothetical protein VLA37_10055, partial [Sphingomonadaceae bacterium]|nr:hypothetical protein [Sphingomonadaceae bacterium]
MARSTASFGLALSLAVVSVEPALAQLADDTQLSVVDIDGNIAPLTPQQLDANEQPAYAALVPGSAEATRFLYTRAFLRYARLVVDGKLLPEDLPALPDRANWDRTYLSEAEARIVDDALGMNIAAHFNPPVRHGAMAATEDLPAVDAEGNM